MTQAERKEEYKRNWEYMRDDWPLRPSNKARKRLQGQLCKARGKTLKVQHNGPAAVAA